MSDAPSISIRPRAPIGQATCEIDMWEPNLDPPQWVVVEYHRLGANEWQPRWWWAKFNGRQLNPVSAEWLRDVRLAP